MDIILVSNSPDTRVMACPVHMLQVTECTMILPTMSEGDIDFTIPKPARLGFASTLGLRDGKSNATLTYGW